MFQRSKKRPPPRPPPPNFSKFRSKSSHNLAQQTVDSLIEWSPPCSPKQPQKFGGSISSSFSSSSSGSVTSLASSKRSLENNNLDGQSLSSYPAPGTSQRLAVKATKPPSKVTSQHQNTQQVGGAKPRIIWPQIPKKATNEGGSKAMPKYPPPVLPKGHYDVITPHGVALYEFKASQPGDLPLCVNDVVELVRRVDGDWLYGKVCEKEGIFPENFVQIVVPLPGETEHGTSEANIVTALYEFSGEVEGDLPLKPGQKVRVIRAISEDWLYGKSNGALGQFPKNFVT